VAGEPEFSDVLTALPNGTKGCRFETDDVNRIVFVCFALEWLTGVPA
jgi:hypothetical protein